MSNDKESKDLKLEDLEKPLTELEMKETTGGAGTVGASGTIAPLPKVSPRGTSRSSN
ncbi:hypothetical protein [Paenibacillus foliorum]|uniref:hypothetical protein n=1 Tax=Paenibacillus foliorum TaxID=2654974 RepID=UPI001490FB71|nr:hypothetical protein [Paenibacillus foliorum]